MKRTLWAALLVLLAAAAAAGCSAIDDVRSASDTVDQAVDLLDAIEQRGAWDAVADGLDALNSQTAGYQATIHIQAGPVDEAGEFAGALSENVTIELQVDAQRAVLAGVTTDGARRTFYVEPPFGASNVYENVGGDYVCANDAAPLLRAGLDGIFETYGVAATGVRLLSVANEVDGDVSVAGRSATRYELESKVPDAIAILQKFGNPELQTRLDQAGDFKLSGGLYLDEETGALLAFASDYADRANGERALFSFEIAQWDDIPPISPPAAGIAQPCVP